ncbi:hypothetical protein F5Y13DRAFT_165312 [Hypoxylon sp. FL1857]|nr:hypothetical protein F5Y13DRAFT_165312 [Hypoxylon sp. FL1857]
MRSHPYTPPPPLPPLLTELSAYLPNRDRSDNASDSDVALLDLDPDTSRLLPRKRQQHHVRIQGRLAPVRSVSVANLRSSSCSPSRHDRKGFDSAVGGTMPRRRRSWDDSMVDVEEEEGIVGERDTQLRGYGIGGRGNIRRPMDVIGAQAKTSLSISSLFSTTGSGSGSTTPRSFSGPNPDKRFSISGLLTRIEERKGKERSI